MAIKKVMIGLDEDLLKHIDQKAKSEHRSRSNYIEFSLMEIDKLKEKESILNNKIAELEKLIKTIPQQSTQQPVIIKEEPKSGFTKSSKILDEVPEL